MTSSSFEVKHLSNPSQLDGGKTHSDLPTVFTGNTYECFEYCEKLPNVFFKLDTSLFGGYFANEKTGECYFIW